MNGFALRSKRAGPLTETHPRPLGKASSLTRLRHPCVLETQEPLEETRNELIFATEAVLAPLSEALIASESSGRASDNVQLDEVEIQKGLLQVARGLEFLHSARMIHGNLTPDAILINAKVRRAFVSAVLPRRLTGHRHRPYKRATGSLGASRS